MIFKTKVNPSKLFIKSKVTFGKLFFLRREYKNFESRKSQNVRSLSFDTCLIFRSENFGKLTNFFRTTAQNFLQALPKQIQILTKNKES